MLLSILGLHNGSLSGPVADKYKRSEPRKLFKLPTQCCAIKATSRDVLDPPLGVAQSDLSRTLCSQFHCAHQDACLYPRSANKAHPAP